MAMPSSRKSIRSASQLLEPPLKRQKTGSDTSTSTLSDGTISTAMAAQSACLVTSEDLSSMVFHAADLQRVTNSWSTHCPLTYYESEMMASFKACENTANSLRSTLESLEVKAAKAHIACNWADNTGYPRSSYEVSVSRDDAEAIARKLKSEETMKFLIQSGIERIVDDEFIRLSRFKGTLRNSYQQWILHKGAIRDSIMKTVEEEADPLVDFESKVKGYFQQDVIERATSELKREMELQWKEFE